MRLRTIDLAAGLCALLALRHVARQKAAAVIDRRIVQDAYDIVRLDADQAWNNYRAAFELAEMCLPSSLAAAHWRVVARRSLNWHFIVIDFDASPVEVPAWWATLCASSAR